MFRKSLALLVLASTLSSVGCSMCSSCTDHAPNYEGGIYGHYDMSQGRIGSAFSGQTATTLDSDAEYVD
jgi:hypothetical protein